jgi:WD40 repeat protein
MRIIFALSVLLASVGLGIHPGHVHQMDNDTTRLLRTLKRPRVVTLDDHTVSLAFSPRQHWLAAGHSLDSIQLWKTLTWKEQPALNEDTVDAVTFSPDGKYLVVTDVGGILVWNPQTGRQIRSIDFNDNAVDVNCAVFSPDGRLLAAGSGTSDSDKEIDVKVWNTTTWRCVYRLKAHEHSVNGIYFSPDGRTLMIGGGNGKLKLVNTATWRVVRAITLTNGIKSLAISSDGKRLATGDFGGKVTLWDTGAWRKVRTLNIQAEDAKYSLVESTTFSPDGQYLAAACDKAVMLWKVVNGEVVHTFSDASHAVAFSPDGRLLAVGNQKGAAGLWTLPTR